MYAPPLCYLYHNASEYSNTRHQNTYNDIHSSHSGLVKNTDTKIFYKANNVLNATTIAANLIAATTSLAAALCTFTGVDL